MDNAPVEHLLEKYKNGTCNSSEKAAVEAWYNARISSELRTSIDEDLIGEQNFIWKSIITKLDSPDASRNKFRITLIRVVGIAAAFAAVLFGLLFFNAPNDSDILDNSLAIEKFKDIQTGTNGASLTLANGKTIKLSSVGNGRLAKEAGVTITKSTSGELIYKVQDADADVNSINTLSTAKGETYKVQLPDGSIVWLNAASSLSYSVKLVKDGKRLVKLQGEGYFEVSKDKSHPFYVETSNQTVRVLGTHFNINSYNDEPAVVTTLTEGAIELKSAKETSLMIPGQQAVNHNGSLKISAAGMPDALAWKNGYFDFNEENIQSIMKKLARWYNLEVFYQGKPAIQGFTGKLSRNNNISQVLKALESTNTVQFKIEERRVTVITK